MELDIGHSLLPPPKNTLTIYTQNINGLKQDLQENTIFKCFDQLLCTMKDCEINVFGWADTNTEWKHYATNQKLYMIFRQHLPGGCWAPSTSNIPFTTIYKTQGEPVGPGPPNQQPTEKNHPGSHGAMVQNTITGKSF